MRAVWLLVAAPALAFADVDLDDPPPTPKLISVGGKLTGAVAELTVRYELATRAALSRDQVHLAIPPGGIVIGATAIVDGHRHALELRDAGATGSALDALGSAAVIDGMPWTFAIAAEDFHPDEVALTVGAPHAATVAIELVAETATCFYRDARYAQIDPAWRVAHAIGDDLDAHCGLTETDAPHAWLRFGDGVLAKQPSGEARIGMTADRLALSSTEIARVEIDVAGMLADVPRDLYTAIVIDNSRSVGDRAQWEQTELVESYLNKAPAGRVQVIAYDRRARALLPDWATASSARAMIAKSLSLLDPANGSNLDAGFVEAERWLAGVHGTKRIVAFSDEQLPSHVVPADIVVPSDILVHTVALRGGDGLIDRDDASVLAQIATRSEGVGFATQLDRSDRDTPPPVDATELVHPIAFEDVQVISHERLAIRSVDAAECDGQALLQGESCTWWSTGGDGPIHVTGRIWGHAIDRELAPSDAHATELARRLVDEPTDDKLEAEIALVARAVDSAWSLIASWGGSGGYADRVGHSAGTGGFGCGCGHGRFSGSGRRSSGFITSDSLEAQLARATRACGIPRGGVGAELELTDDEIVDVTVEAPDAVKPCVTEAIWNANVLTGERGHRVVKVAVR